MRPIYHQLSDRIEQYIADNRITGRMPGILRLSDELGMNRVTLQKAFRELERRGVVTICGTRGTFVNSKAPQRSRYYAIGVIGTYTEKHDIKDGFPPQLYRLAERYGYQVVGISSSGLTSELLAQFPVDGFIMLGSSSQKDTVDYLLKQRIPVVGNLNLDPQSTDRVEFDHYRNYSAMVQRLKLLGHRRIAFVEFKRQPEFQFYIETIRKAFHDNLGDDFDDELFYVKEFGEDLWQQHGEAYRQIYAEQAATHLLTQPKPPTALIFSYIAPMSEELKRRGIKIPDDMSVFACCYPWELLSGTTTMRQNIEELMTWGFQRLLKRLADPNLPQETHLIPGNYHDGGTIAPPRSGRIKSKFLKGE